MLRKRLVMLFSAVVWTTATLCLGMFLLLNLLSNLPGISLGDLLPRL
ncbi:hypothetical protein VT98_14821, partial [Candidatus Electrothrix communis]